MRYLTFLSTLLLIALVSLANAKEKAPECEVCLDLINQFTETLTADDRKSLQGIESKIDKFCDASKNKLSTTFKKMCYFISPMKREISQPLMNGVPTDRLCKRLKKKSAEICAIRPPVQVEKGVTDYNSLRVKQLKKILSDRGVSCNNCLEKSEFVKKCKETEHMEL